MQTLTKIAGYVSGVGAPYRKKLSSSKYTKHVNNLRVSQPEHPAHDVTFLCMKHTL